MNLPQIIRNPTSAPWLDFSNLRSTDEPRIFHFGGKLMREYLNECGLEDEGKDYEIRAICKNMVTIAAFRKVFKAVRDRSFAKSPTWLPGAMRHTPPLRGPNLPYTDSTIRFVKILQQAGTGFLTLFPTEGVIGE